MKRTLITIVLTMPALIRGSAALGDEAGRPPETGAGVEIRRDVCYLDRESSRLLADVYLPVGTGPYPAVLVIPGGGWAFGGKWQMQGICYRLAEKGFVAAAIDYRLAPKFTFPAQVEDCQEALRWMVREGRRYKISQDWLAVYGYSAGGQLALLLATRYTGEGNGAAGPSNQGDAGPAPAQQGQQDLPAIRAVAAGGAPSDFRGVPPESPVLAYWLGGTRRQKPQQYWLASPAAFVSATDPPTFLFHGGDDRLVPLANMNHMARLLAGAGVHVETHTVAKKGHVGAFQDDDATRRVIEFFATCRRNGEADQAPARP